MVNKFVTYPVAKALSEIGFNEPCLAYFIDKTTPTFVIVGQGDRATSFNSKKTQTINNVLAPLWQDVIEWFNVKHNMYIQESCVFEDTGNRYYFKVTLDYGILKGCYVVSAPRLDLTEAREVAILAVIEMLIEKLKTQDSIVPIDVIVKKIPYVEVNKSK